MKKENHEPLLTQSKGLLSLPPPEAQVSSSAPYFHTPPEYVLSLMTDTKDHTHIKQKAKFQFCQF